MKFHKKYLLLFAFIITAFTILSSNQAMAQFGKNKVQYKQFKWKFIQSKHFDIYFYQGGEYLADYTAKVAEQSLDSMSKNLNGKISNRIPIIVFESHNDFQQNNVIDVFLPEGVGGVTELFKNRILVPFEGDYEKFKHVIHHELLHAYMNDVFYGGSIQNIISRNITLVFPLWFNEGMAEYVSLSGMNKENDMFMRDAVINDYVPQIEYVGGYLAYRAGQSFFSFLADYYGKEKIGKLFNEIKSSGDMHRGFKNTFGIELEKLNEKWHKYLNQTYWSDSKLRTEVTDFSKQLTDITKDGGFYNIAPEISPDGKYFLFISNRNDLFDVFLARTEDGKVIETIIEGQTTPDFEELQVLTPGLSWAPDGRRAAISVKAGSEDAIFIFNVKSGDRQKLPVHMGNISYVSWSPAGNELAFVGTNNKQSDIYLYDISTGTLQNLTDDIFSDSEPTWSPDGEYVYFTSDRGSFTENSMIPADFNMFDYDNKQKDIYSVNTDTKELKRITNIPFSNQSYAKLSQDGNKLLFISDVNGISNLYLMDKTETGFGNMRAITNSQSPVDQLSISKDGKKLLMVSLNKGGYDIFMMEGPFDRQLDIDTLPLTQFVQTQRLNRELADSVGNKKATNDSFDSGDTFTSADTTKDSNLTVYGDKVEINFSSSYKDSSYKSATSYADSIYKNNPNFRLSGNVNPDGSFVINDYKVKFSPDFVYGNANYSSFYGVQGLASISLSDMLGNHRIAIITSMVIDLKNSDYAVGYYYLPGRIDYGAELFHTARFLLYNRFDGRGEQLYRYRNFGATLNASYPFNRFKRIDGGISVQNVSQENLDNSQEPIIKKTFIVPSLSFVHDNTIFGSTKPIKGTRYNITALASPKLGNDGIGFTSLIGDYRTYFKLADGYNFALRLSGGASWGPNPQRFYLGGTQNWLNREFENENIPIGNIEEYSFSYPGLPLRGYNYDRISGSKYALLNAEFRLPIIQYLILGILPIGFQNIEGVIFVDAGTAWRNDKDLKLFTRENGVFQSRDLLTGMGVGSRINFLGFPIMFDVAWAYNFNSFSKPKYYISFGYDW